MMGRRSLINRRSTAHQSNSVKSPSQSKAADFFDSIDPKQHRGLPSTCTAFRSPAPACKLFSSTFSGLVGEPCHDGVDVGVGKTFLAECRHFLLGPGAHRSGVA
jgi:hypothetical protein